MERTQVMSLLLAIAFIMLSPPVFSQQVRTFPTNSKLGKLTSVSFPLFTINGQQMQMGAGGQMRGINNLIILPNTASYNGLVRYQLDVSGNLHRVWILTPEEAKQAEREELHKPK